MRILDYLKALLFTAIAYVLVWAVLFFLWSITPLYGETVRVGMTPTSNVAIKNGRISFGCEAFFDKPSTGDRDGRGYNQAVLVIETEPGQIVRIDGGSVAVRPPDPKFKTGFFGAGRLWYAETDGLFRVHVNDLPMPTDTPVFSFNMEVSIEPETETAYAHTYTTSRYLIVEFQEAGAGGGVGLELQLTGTISKPVQIETPVWRFEGNGKAFRTPASWLQPTPPAAPPLYQQRPRTPRAKDDIRFEILLGVYQVANYLDTATTVHLAAQPGFREANPLMRPFAGHPAAAGIAKGGAQLLFTWGMRKVHKRDRKTALWTTAAVAGLTTFVAIRNARQIP